MTFTCDGTYLPHFGVSLGVTFGLESESAALLSLGSRLFSSLINDILFGLDCFFDLSFIFFHDAALFFLESGLYVRVAHVDGGVRVLLFRFFCLFLFFLDGGSLGGAIGRVLAMAGVGIAITVVIRRVTVGSIASGHDAACPKVCRCCPWVGVRRLFVLSVFFCISRSRIFTYVDEFLDSCW